MIKTFTVKVPATTANIGPGFDCLGMALDIWNTMVFSVTNDKQNKVIVTGEGSNTLSIDDDNLILKSVKRYFAYFNTAPPTLLIECHNEIPVARGLGSSSSAIIGGLLAAAKISGHEIDYNLILNLATELEGHSDNIAPALLGGCVLVLNDKNQNLICQKIVIPQNLRVVLYIPGFSMTTNDSRNVLNGTVTRDEAVFNIARIGLLINAFNTGDYELLSIAMQDSLHQPSRKAFFRGMDILIKSALDGGALGACLSGSGSTILAFTHGREITVTYEMRDAGDKLQLDGEAKITSPSLKGAYSF